MTRARVRDMESGFIKLLQKNGKKYTFRLRMRKLQRSIAPPRAKYRSGIMVGFITQDAKSAVKLFEEEQADHLMRKGHSG